MTLTTTLNRIRTHSPCQEGWGKLLEGLGKTAPDDEPLPYVRIVEINGLDDALLACRCEPQYGKEWRLFAVWCARQVEHLMADERSRAAVDTAERYANSQATKKELDAAWAASDAARAAAWATAWAAASDAASAAAWAAAWAASDAARAAARAAAWATAWAAASDAAWDAASDAAWATARAAQTEQFIKTCSED